MIMTEIRKQLIYRIIRRSELGPVTVDMAGSLDAILRSLDDLIKKGAIKTDNLHEYSIIRFITTEREYDVGTARRLSLLETKDNMVCLDHPRAPIGIGRDGYEDGN